MAHVKHEEKKEMPAEKESDGEESEGDGESSEEERGTRLEGEECDNHGKNNGCAEGLRCGSQFMEMDEGMRDMMEKKTMMKGHKGKKDHHDEEESDGEEKEGRRHKCLRSAASAASPKIQKFDCLIMLTSHDHL